MSDLFLDTVKVEQSLETEIFDNFLSLRSKAKELLPQINWVITQRKVEYLSELFKLKAHTSVQIRRKVAQGVGFLASQEDLEELQKWQLSESDRETWLVLESTFDKIQRGKAGESLEKNIRVLSVGEALSLVKRLVNENQYIVEGEILDIQPNRQVYYFGLKDSQDNRVSCMIFVGHLVRAGFPLNEGLSVRITGKFKISQKQARLYIEVESIQLTGEGELLRNLKLLEETLRREGLFEDSRKRSIPLLPKNILLLASENSAAYTDYLRTFKERRGGAVIYLLPIKTQGVGAEFELLEKLDEAHQLSIDLEIDLLVLTRGGGSSDDLMVFNSEKVVRAVHGLVKPIIVAIGHERDTTLAELVADLRASTPTRAAELSSLSWQEVKSQLAHKETELRSYFLSRREEYIHFSEIKFKIISNSILKQIHEYKSLLNYINQLTYSSINQTKLLNQKLWQNILSNINGEIKNVSFLLAKVKNLDRSLENYIAQIRDEILLKNKRLYEIAKQNINIIRTKFDLTASQIFLHDPENILKKGYVIIKQKDKVVDSVTRLKAGSINLKFWDGDVDIKTS